MNQNSTHLRSLHGRLWISCIGAFLLPMLAFAQPSLLSPTGPGERFDLVRDGKPACAIVIAERPSPAARLAALELQSHVLKITGVELPLRHDAEPTPGARILVGESAATRALGLRGTDFAPQEYLIGFRTNALVLIGRDWADTEANRREPGRTINDQRLADLRHKIDYWKAVGLPDRGSLELELPGVFDDQGTCYATYDFLERFCGVRWYGPTDLTSVIPKRGDLSVQGEDIRRAPALKHRNALSTASWPFLRGQWGDFHGCAGVPALAQAPARRREVGRQSHHPSPHHRNRAERSRVPGPGAGEGPEPLLHQPETGPGTRPDGARLLRRQRANCPRDSKPWATISRSFRRMSPSTAPASDAGRCWIAART